MPNIGPGLSRRPAQAKDDSLPAQYHLITSSTSALHLSFVRSALHPACRKPSSAASEEQCRELGIHNVSCVHFGTIGSAEGIQQCSVNAAHHCSLHAPRAACTPQTPSGLSPALTRCQAHCALLTCMNCVLRVSC